MGTWVALHQEWLSGSTRPGSAVARMSALKARALGGLPQLWGQQTGQCSGPSSCRESPGPLTHSLMSSRHHCALQGHQQLPAPPAPI